MEFVEIYEKMESVRKYAKDNYVPIIRDNSARFLYDFVKNNKYRDILEIGTAIGYSGSIIMSAGAKSLTTVDINEHSLSMAKQLFSEFGFENNIDVICDDAKNLLNTLVASCERFDMIFLDGAKGQYINYLPMLKKLLNPNGVIFADNVLLGGMVESSDVIPHKKRSMVNNLRKYLNAVTHDPYETEIVRIEDGIAITKVKGENIDD